MTKQEIFEALEIINDLPFDDDEIIKEVNLMSEQSGFNFKIARNTPQTVNEWFKKPSHVINALGKADCSPFNFFTYFICLQNGKLFFFDSVQDAMFPIWNIFKKHIAENWDKIDSEVSRMINEGTINEE